MTTSQIKNKRALPLRQWSSHWRAAFRAASLAQRSLYRLRQFYQAAFKRPTAGELEAARQALSAAEFALFQKLQPSEQLHSLQVLNRLAAQGVSQADLLAAALLHDVGKSRLPLAPWERALAVLVKAFLPGLARRWGELPPERAGWRRALVVMQQHAAWGAALAMEAGSSAHTVNLIRRHQEAAPVAAQEGMAPEEDYWLRLLQDADNEY